MAHLKFIREKLPTNRFINKISGNRFINKMLNNAPDVRKSAARFGA